MEIMFNFTYNARYSLTSEADTDYVRCSMNHTNFRLDTLNFAASAFINTTTAAGFYVTSKGKRLQGSVSIHTRKNLPLPIFTYLRSRLAGKRIKRHLESSILLVETVVIIALLVKQMNNTKKLSSLVVQLSETLIRLKEDFKR